MRGTMSSKHAIVLKVAGVLTLAACDRLVDPLFPSDAQEFSPPGVYSTWWNMTQACSSLTGPLNAVHWYKTDQPLRDARTGEPITGYWNSIDNRIVLMNDAVLDGGSVRHEMLHALVRKVGHPRSQFLGKCLGTVPCQGACIRDAGPYQQPPETPTHIKGDSLEITVDIEPRNPNSAHDGGFFSMTVLVRNRTNHWATVPNYFSYVFSGVDSSSTFDFDVRGPAGGIIGGEVRMDPSEWIFAPDETKKQVFDFSIGNNSVAYQLPPYRLPPGNYIARGGYSEWMSSDSTFVIGP